MRVPDVELLWWEGCPSTERTLADLREALSATGLDPDSVRMREIETDAEAAATAFPGSPTILIDGADIAPSPEAEPVGLTCRNLSPPRRTDLAHARPGGRPRRAAPRGDEPESGGTQMTLAIGAQAPEFEAKRGRR